MIHPLKFSIQRITNKQSPDIYFYQYFSLDIIRKTRHLYKISINITDAISLTRKIPKRKNAIFWRQKMIIFIV